MGRAGKTKRAEKRKAQKKAIKMARATLYKSYAGQGRKAKKKGHKMIGGGVSAHPGNCGNVGCKMCFPRHMKVAA